MGRPYTGAMAIQGMLQLNVDKLNFKNLTSGVEHGTINWENGSNVNYIFFRANYERTLELHYTHSGADGVKHSIEYKIRIISRPSNLGMGENLYFMCPFSRKLCKKLYKGYGSHYFKHREAHRYRVYYESQRTSKLDRHNSRYWDLDRTIEKLDAKQVKTHYRGKETRLQQRINKLTEQREYCDLIRWTIFPASIRKHFAAQGMVFPKL